MLLDKIISNVNRLVGNNSSARLRYRELEFYLDSAVDVINLELRPGVPFKPISELFDSETTLPNEFNYEEIPEQYIRSVLIYLTAALYLEEEDETEQQYQIYRARANTSLVQWKKEEYSDYDITDYGYPYDTLSPIKSFVPRNKKLRKEVKQVKEEIKDYLEELESEGETIPISSPYWED